MINSIKTTSLVAVAETINGTAFCYLPQYTTQQGETAKYFVQLGYSHENALVHDFEVLKHNKLTIYNELTKKYPLPLVKQAFNEMYVSLEKRTSSEETKQKLRDENDITILKSDAMKNGFEFLAKGIFKHIESGLIHVRGLQTEKVILTEIAQPEPKADTRGDKTKIKVSITKLCNLRSGKIRSFIITDVEIRLQKTIIK
jgi:hypothetical protein